MTNLEITAIALANEVEAAVKQGVKLPTNLILMLNQFRSIQIASGDYRALDQMFNQVNAVVINLAEHRRFKVFPKN